MRHAQRVGVQTQLMGAPKRSGYKEIALYFFKSYCTEAAQELGRHRKS